MATPTTVPAPTFSREPMDTLEARYRANTKQIEDQWAQLIEDHEDEWVVAHDSELLYGDTLAQVMLRAQRAQLPLNVVAVKHLQKRRPIMLL